MVVGVGINLVVIVGDGVPVAGLVIIPGVIVTVGAALVVPQAERTRAAEQNNKQSFINMGTSTKPAISGVELNLICS
jgi:hypothetical protein